MHRFIAELRSIPRETLLCWLRVPDTAPPAFRQLFELREVRECLRELGHASPCRTR